MCEEFAIKTIKFCLEKNIDVFSAVHDIEELNILFIEETYQNVVFNCPALFTLILYNELSKLLSFYNCCGLPSSLVAVRQVIPCILSFSTFLLCTSLPFSGTSYFYLYLP